MSDRARCFDVRLALRPEFDPEENGWGLYRQRCASTGLHLRFPLLLRVCRCAVLYLYCRRGGALVNGRMARRPTSTAQAPDVLVRKRDCGPSAGTGRNGAPEVTACAIAGRVEILRRLSKDRAEQFLK